ncbi:MAG: diacylglycerol kinase family protein [Bacilli bacterium]|nr:diacylglycerol kinase family protein [Bacilli bacterium]
MKYNVLYNPYSANGTGADLALKVKDSIQGDFEFFNMVEINDFNSFFEENKDDIIICGGDGTLNYFINHTKNIKYKNNILYYSTGTGNDFYNEVGNNTEMPFRINEYLDDLPIATVNDKDYYFLNGIGYGIDGFCCEEKDRLYAKKNKPVNYTLIALKGLLYKYRRVNAKVTVDGVVYKFKNVWLSPTMNGKFYGGGMKIAPNQDRLNKERTVTTVVVYSKTRLIPLIYFPLIFTGNHVNKNHNIKIFEGNEIKVEFDRPTALQIDGETFLNINEYKVKTRIKKS